MSSDKMSSDLNKLAESCYANASSKGFYNVKTRIEELIHDAVIRGEMELAQGEKLFAEFQSVWALSRIALIMSELGEAVEAARKPNLVSDHVPDMPLLHEEMADVVIRVADFMGSVSANLGDCVDAKMAYNVSRPFMHGKLS